MSPIDKAGGYPEKKDFKLKGRKKTMNTALQNIVQINKSVGWGKMDDVISVTRYLEEKSRVVFATSQEDAAIGYAIAKHDDRDIYYLSFIAVNPEVQQKGIGMRLLLRIIEKVKKKEGKKLILEYEDGEKLDKFYTSDRIPYAKNLYKHTHRWHGDGPWKNLMEYDLTDDYSWKKESPPLRITSFQDDPEDPLTEKKG